MYNKTTCHIECLSRRITGFKINKNFNSLHVVKDTERHAKQHMGNAENDRDLLFIRVGERDLVHR